MIVFNIRIRLATTLTVSSDSFGELEFLVSNKYIAKSQTKSLGAWKQSLGRSLTYVANVKNFRRNNTFPPDVNQANKGKLTGTGGETSNVAY